MCWKCGKALDPPVPVPRTETCPSCGNDVRSCRNCRFWSPGSWHDCAERVEDAPRDKERANFCDNFSLNPAYKADHGTGTTGNTGSARSAFDGLFS